MKMKNVSATISFLIIGSLFLIIDASAQNASGGKLMPNLSDWPKASQTAAKEMITTNNLLALNLAHDIVTGKKSVQEARQAYGDIVKEKMNGGSPEYHL